MTLKLGDTYVYEASAEITKPWCIGNEDESLTLWIEDNKIVGALKHKYVDGRIVDIKGAGQIPAEYVAYEASARL